jgi:hypothetical protein
MRKMNEKRIPTTQDAGRGKMQNKKKGKNGKPLFRFKKSYRR